MCKICCHAKTNDIRVDIHRDVATGRPGDHDPSTSISEQNKVQQIQFQTSGILLFYWCSEIIRTRNFTIFTVYAKIFGQFTAAFYFFKLYRGNRTSIQNGGPTEKFFIVDRPKEGHDE